MPTKQVRQQYKHHLKQGEFNKVTLFSVMVYTNVDRELRELALSNWDAFKKLTGVDDTKFRICQERRAGKSYSQIAIAVKVHRSKAQRVCQVCP